MNFNEAQALVATLSHEQRLAVAVLTKHLTDKCIVRGYELGLEHGEAGVRADPGFLFAMLDQPE